MNHPRIRRIILLVDALRTEPPKTITALAKHIGVSQRSVYRYLALLKELGFMVEPDEHGRPVLIGEDPFKGLKRR